MASLIAPPTSDATADAEALRKACEGWGSDKKEIIEIIAHRTAPHLKLIKDAYFHNYNEDLISRLERELHGDFERAVCRWLLDPMDREALFANMALKKGDYKVIVEISCTSTSDHLFGVRRAYLARYNHSLEEDVAVHTADDVRKLLLLLVSAYRKDTNVTEAKLAEAEAEIINEAVKDKHYNHDDIIRIVGTRSKAQLVATFFRYKDIYGDSITKHLTEEHEDAGYVSLLKTAIECIWLAEEHYESVLREAIIRTGTDEDTLSRVIVTRAEKDLAQIKEFYYKRNSVALEEAVAKHTHGDYKHFLLTLLGAQSH